MEDPIDYQILTFPVNVCPVTSGHQRLKDLEAAAAFQTQHTADHGLQQDRQIGRRLDGWGWRSWLSHVRGWHFYCCAFCFGCWKMLIWNLNFVAISNIFLASCIITILPFQSCCFLRIWRYVTGGKAEELEKSTLDWQDHWGMVTSDRWIWYNLQIEYVSKIK